MNQIALAKLASIHFELDLVGEYEFKSLASMPHVTKYLEFNFQAILLKRSSWFVNLNRYHSIKERSLSFTHNFRYITLIISTYVNLL